MAFPAPRPRPMHLPPLPSDTPDRQLADSLAEGAAQAAAATVPAVFELLDRDHSILAFNERVLDWAGREDVPLLERLRYLCIVSSNLDELFEVRAAAHLMASTPPTPPGVTRLPPWPAR